MTHLIAGYPDNEASFQAALGMARGGAAYLEIQFPFSDPSADGPTIQGACQVALENGWKSADGWKLIARLREAVPNIPIYIMTYASLIFTPGIRSFCEKAKNLGVFGLIIPDLAPGQDEGLGEVATEFGLEILPVIVPSVSEKRLVEILGFGYRRLYVALRSGITGTHTELSTEIQTFLAKLKQMSVEVFGGFGIDSRQQVEMLSPLIHAAVVGSVLVRALGAVDNKAGSEAYGSAAESKVRELLGTHHA